MIESERPKYLYFSVEDGIEKTNEMDDERHDMEELVAVTPTETPA